MNGSVRARCRALAMASALIISQCGVIAAAEEAAPPWWLRYPTYVGDIGGISPEQAARLDARMVSGNYAADPAWGPFGQMINGHDAAESFRKVHQSGARWISWVEGFGDCMVYAAALRRAADGSYEGCPDDTALPRLVRTAWSWESSAAQPNEVLRWVGLHNCINNEDFLPPSLRCEHLGLTVPHYPDGREAVGWIPDGQYPANARVYDACCAKDINGRVSLGPSMPPQEANSLHSDTHQPKGSTAGLFRVQVSRDTLSAFPGHKVGDTVYVSALSIAKDAAAPFWIDEIRVSVREMLRRGIDGVWCDNFSPWDNFGQFDRALGDWSEHRFRGFLTQHFTADQLRKIGIGDATTFQVRDYLKAQAARFHAVDASDPRDPAWRDSQWLDDPVWNAYKVFKQQVGQETLKSFYRVIKDEARSAGRTDFLVAGNDMPIFGLGWVRDEYLDMVSSELTSGSYLTTGPRGVMLPPLGKSAVVYRAALEHQQGPYATIWYYLNGEDAKYRRCPELSKVLMAEAFANNTFLKFGGTPEHPGTPDSVACWNSFVTREEPRFGRRVPLADIGVLFSPDNQLGLLAPAGPPDVSCQPHSFGYWGFATALVDAHLPYRAVVDWKLRPEALVGLQTLVIPDASCLDDPVLSVLEEWVQSGGRLVVTGPSGTRRGTAGMFARRSASLLSPLAGIDISDRSQDTSVHSRKAGKGTVIWTPGSVGATYYVQHSSRAMLLPQLLELLGESSLWKADELPVTVGVSGWKAVDGQSLFVDLVNYDWDRTTDRVAPAKELRLRLRRPEHAQAVEATTLSPDAMAPATVELHDEWIDIRLPELIHFASVKCSFKST